MMGGKDENWVEFSNIRENESDTSEFQIENIVSISKELRKSRQLFDK